MNPPDLLKFSFRAASGYPGRTFLLLLAMSIGVASVVLLTALGEGAREYVREQFLSLGTHLLIVLPGRTETVGGPPPLLGQTPRDLTLADALALKRSTFVYDVAPMVVGSAPVSWKQRDREVSILGATPSFFSVRKLSMFRGKFLPGGDPSRGTAICVMGYDLKKELFGKEPALGKWVRIGDRRFRVIGILASEGQSLGVNMDDLAIVPVASAQSLFNISSLFRILVQAESREAIAPAKTAIREIIRQRHDGEDDVTIITQDAMLSTFDRILKALTLAVAGIAAISLAVAGILIMNVMLIAVSQRVTEIGLLKAVGATERQIKALFLSEATFLSFVGAALGLVLAYAGTRGLVGMFPGFPVQAPLWALGAATGIAILTGLVFGVLPAKRAARLDPVTALSGR